MRVGLFFNHELEASAEAASVIQSSGYGGGDAEFVTGDAGVDHGEIDFAVSIGGDGTFLLTSKTVMGRGAPLYGVNTGRLGFLASGDARRAAADVTRILDGDYETFPIVPLKAVIMGKRGAESATWAFNEVMIVKNLVSRPIALSAHIDGKKLYSFLADGIIVSAPIGSTAYSLSAGGPIVHPGVSAQAIVPICAHSLTPRPMLVPASTLIEIELESPPEGATLSADGMNGTFLSPGDTVGITSDPAGRVDVIRLEGGSYPDVLRDKLNWS
ncbi:MAG: NAD(+)/NADH kinase [Synergistaceae bacterium]|jgi:NAD+ kinase|nr:NAD(+)/NADH kinase [Synergistaceae bacterium]